MTISIASKHLRSGFLFFQLNFGVTTHDYDAPVENIVLEFKPLQAKYFKSKPFHTFKTIEETDEKLIVQLQLVVNYELIRKISGMGNEVRVLSPQSLVEKIKSHFEDALKQYL